MNRKIYPPKLPLRFFRWYCHPDFVEDIEGDLLERFEIRIVEKGIRSAKRLFMLDVIRLFKPGIIKPLTGIQKLNNYGMIRNNIKTAFRIFARTRFFTTINIIGLALGFATCILLLGYVKFETSYESYIKNADEVYRVITSRMDNDKVVSKGVKGPSRLSEIASIEIAGVEASTLAFFEPCLVRTDDKKLADQSVYWVDKDFLNVFKGILISGNPKTALDGPLKMVITESKAYALFGDEDPMGKQVKVNEGMPFQVTGVVKDPPENTHLKYDFLHSIETFRYYGWRAEKGNWTRDNSYTYFTFNPSLINEIEEATNKLALIHVNPEKNGGKRVNFEMQPINDIHLRSHFTDEPEVNGDINQIYIISGLGLAILIIVFINFVNLSTALSLKRSKDTGVRKTLGATKKQLQVQYLVEAFLINTIAILGASVMALIGQSFLENYLNITFDFSVLSDTRFWLWTGVFFIGCVVAVGFYPAIILSSFNPVTALKGKMSNGKTKNNKVKQVLLTFQFAASVFLTVGAYIVYEQVSFMKNYDLGINTEQVIVMRGPTTYNTSWNDLDQIKLKSDRYRLFRQQLLQNSFVKSVGSCMNIPSEEADAVFNSLVLETSGEEVQAKIEFRTIDHNFFPVYDVQFLSGENFGDYGDLIEKKEVIINEKTSRLLGFDNPDRAIGEIVRRNGTKWKIIGVVANFHMRSVSESISPAFFINRHAFAFGYYIAKLNPQNISNSLEIIESKWKEMYPEDPFMVRFSDSYFDQQYKKYEQFGGIFNCLTLLAIFISNLGLLALVSLAVTEKLKEVGIRKVLGAEWFHILILFFKNFAGMILISIVIALPLSWYFAHNWLQEFAYRIDLSLIGIVGCAFFILIISLMNILYFVLKALRHNPVDILKDE